MRPRVTLVVITLNEERNILRCLSSVPWADDIVVLDSSSTDRTQEIARSMGARVYDEPFRGYREQKQRATDLAKHDWVISLDADEALSPELSDEIQRRFVQGEPLVDGFLTSRLSFHMGRWIHHGGWFPDRQVRIFHRKRARWIGGHVHERVEAPTKERLTYPILHWVFRDLSHQVATNNTYSSRGAQDLYDRGVSFSLVKLIGKPISKFLETYVVKRGFLDGLPGFIISVGAAYSMFLKFAKLWEIQNQQSNAGISSPMAQTKHSNPAKPSASSSGTKTTTADLEDASSTAAKNPFLINR